MTPTDPLSTEVRARINGLFAKIEEVRGFLDLDAKNAEIESIDGRLASPEIWRDQKASQALQQRKKLLDKDLRYFKRILALKEELEVLIELAAEGESVEAEFEASVARLEKDLEEAELRALFSEEDDARNAIMTIHPGAGGTESQDWAEMLLRMYLRYAERVGFEAEVLDHQPGEEAGLKSATVRFEGDFAFGELSQETGVHRLVRISPFDAAKRRHPSFAAVFVYPDIDEDIAVDINPDDIRVDTYRASGAGGQHVNRTDSAVRITHLPTGIVVQCQNERSQHKNKAMALKILKARIYELEKTKQNAKLEKLEDAKSDIAWGNQIRSYVLHPYRMIKDLRTRVETGDTDRVLDGDLDAFIRATLVLRKKAAQTAPQ
ncbi:MAG: peptide chain release factor 2 [Candidatus Aminicenantes bacterium]|nr:peptide chain release factor 2 [Candidatus Aminicenantes bacterium]